MIDKRTGFNLKCRDCQHSSDKLPSLCVITNKEINWDAEPCEKFSCVGLEYGTKGYWWHMFRDKNFGD